MHTEKIKKRLTLLVKRFLGMRHGGFEYPRGMSIFRTVSAFFVTFCHPFVTNCNIKQHDCHAIVTRECTRKCTRKKERLSVAPYIFSYQVFYVSLLVIYCIQPIYDICLCCLIALNQICFVVIPVSFIILFLTARPCPPLSGFS